MVKILASGVIAILTYALVSIGIIKLDLIQKMKKPPEPAAVKSELFKTKSINIPIITDREVKGYIIVQFAYRIEGDDAKKFAEAAELYILDEAISALHKGSAKSGVQLARYQIQEMTPSILKSVQERINSTQVKEVLVQEFSFVPRADVR